MKTLQVLMIAMLIATLYSCNKTENRTNNTVTYEIDSIRTSIIFLTSNDTFYNYTILFRQTYQDSFLNIVYSIQNGDSIKLSSFGFDPWGTPDLGEFALLLNNKYWNNKWKTTGSHESTTQYTQYVYDNQNKIDSVNSILNYYSPEAGVFKVFNYYANRKFNYLENNLTSISENIKRIYPNFTPLIGHDSVEVDYSTATLSYISNYNNQKELIGIDLNDLIINIYNSTNLIKYGCLYCEGSNSAFNDINNALICYNMLSYHTNSLNLIENLTYIPSYFGTLFNSTANTLRATYTFDAAKNNRVTTMTVENVNAQTKMVYTFYYKN